MTLKVRNAPNGVSLYPDPSTWPLVSSQSHWIAGPGEMMSHTHVESSTNGGLPGAPVWGELGDEVITIPVTLQLFMTAGKVIDGGISGTFMGANGQLPIPVIMDHAGPYVGDPMGLVKFTGRMAFNLKDGLSVGIPAHGWCRVRLIARTNFDNGDQLDTELTMPFYSVVDPTGPEVPLGEAGIQLSAKTSNALSHLSPVADLFGIHLTEVEDQSIPLLGAFSTSLYERVFGYSYGYDHSTPGQPGLLFDYQAFMDSDLHHGVPGTQIPSTPFGNDGNFDGLDATVFAASTAPAGFPPGQHRISLQWHGSTGPGFVDETGNAIPAGIEVKSLLVFLTHVGPNPTPLPPLTLISVPNTVGMLQAEAEAVIVAAGFRVGDVSQSISDVASIQTPGTVFRQTPAGENPQPLPPGTLINLAVVWSGQLPQVTVPDVVGQSDSHARLTILAAGLAVGTVATIPSPSPPGTVLSQVPPAGLLVNQGTPVDLVEAIPQPPPCVPAAPTVSVSPSQTIAPGQSATYTVTVQNNDSATCPPRTFTVTASAQ